MFPNKTEAEKALRKLHADASCNGGGGKGKRLSPRPPPVPFKHVLPTRTKSSLVFTAVVREQGTRRKVYLGRSTTAAGAATLAADYLQTPVKDLARQKAQRETPQQSIARVRALLVAFKGWVLADLACAVVFRRRASFMQEQGPAIYVAGLIGKDHAWKAALNSVWAHLPVTERLQLCLLGSRDLNARVKAARVAHDLLSVGFALWAGWTVPRLGYMPWPVDFKRELVPPQKSSERQLRPSACGG